MKSFKSLPITTNIKWLNEGALWPPFLLIYNFLFIRYSLTATIWYQEWSSLVRLLKVDSCMGVPVFLASISFHWTRPFQFAILLFHYFPIF
jgi:hypothetical protein